MASPLMLSSLRLRLPGQVQCLHTSVSSTGVFGSGPVSKASPSSRSCPVPGRGLSRAGQSWSLPAVALQSVDLTDEDRTELQRHPNSDYTIVIAGAGIGGLVLAVSLLKRGFKVKVLERDLTAIRGEGKYRGPIQVQSNALAALEAIDGIVAKRVLEAGCVTGDRINGLVDGVSGKWYVKFDTYHPAVDRGLPVTRVISRTTLQRILAEAVMELAGENVIQNGVKVVGFEDVKVDGRDQIAAVTGDGQKFTGDILIGADGISSKVRSELVGETIANYSQYTCYTGIADFLPPDIDTVGYRVFLGNGKYFVSSDVGNGKMQWYGFHKEAAGGKDEEGTEKDRLLGIFGHWTDMVTDLIKATPGPDIMRRDIFDRPPIFKWTEGRVALLGDSAHAMQPNLGQGGCMAIEDGYQLGKDLAEKAEEARATGRALDAPKVLQAWVRKRLLRVSAVHGLAGMAAIMASTYKAYLGEGLGPLSWIQKFKIPHPGRVGGYLAMNLAMPTMLGWVLGGNVQNLSQKDRLPYCNLNEKPKAFDQSEFYKFMADDRALLHASKAHWILVPLPAALAREDQGEVDSCDIDAPSCSDAFLRIAMPEGSMQIGGQDMTVGSSQGSDIHVSCTQVCDSHARFTSKGREVFVSDLGSKHGTLLNDNPLRPHSKVLLAPGDELRFGNSGKDHTVFRVKMCHDRVWEAIHNGTPLFGGRTEDQLARDEELVAA